MKVVIDGNIGSGKTTQLGLLEQKGFLVFREPIDEWPLEEFYQDPKTGAFPLHMAILRTLRPRGSAIYERSLLSSRWVFWEWAKAKGLASNSKTYEYFYEKHSWHPDLYIFLSKTPEECHRAIQTRGQTGDTHVTLEYLQELDVLYKHLIMKVPCVVHVLNASDSPEEIHAKILTILSHNERSEMLVSDGRGLEVQKSRRQRGGQMFCPSFQDLCRLS
jgi:deoxyadenosine/deoxycytidine kinase